MQDNLFQIKKTKEKFLAHQTMDFHCLMPQNILDIEDKKRSHIFKWRGQFSPQLIENLLLFYCPKNATVLDPFSGSGTVIYEAACLGIQAFGCELNPAAWILSRTYELINIKVNKRQNLLNSFKEKLESHFPNPIFFDTLSSEKIDLVKIENFISNFYEKVDGYEQIILESLVILLDIHNQELTRDRIYNTFFKLSQIIKNLPYSEMPVITTLCDARSLSLENDSVNFVVTSPPYINVFNYHQNYRNSAEFLGWDLLKIAKSEIGSNRANRRNRFFTVTQYCLDLAFVLKEIQRVCQSNSRIIFVVGCESNVLGVPFYNSEIISNIAIQSGGFELIITQQHNFKNKFGKFIREDLLHLVNTDLSISTSKWDKIARNIAYEVLNNGLQLVSEQNKLALVEAIDKVYNLDLSPLYSSQALSSYQTIAPKYPKSLHLFN